MKYSRAGAGLLMSLIMLSLAVLACSLGAATRTPQAIWTPAPVTAAPLPTAAAVLPTQPPATWVMPTPYPVLSPFTPAPAAIAAALATPVPTIDPHHVIITETDIAHALESGAAESNGVQVRNPKVRFTGGKTIITADQVTYSLINVQNLTVTGRLVARNGQLQMDTESVSPQGLVSSMIPSVINQAFKQYTSRWYVEDVQTLEGRIELRIR